ncbi:MAG: hypothetical protein PF569_07130 [Candidatus Woesearchaeota archaeon]|jgi:hypothetical protein|nr:hypothetical protein [Candidatus Woesearchaeota archaeon]
MKNLFKISWIFVFLLIIQFNLSFSVGFSGSMINNSYFKGEVISTGDSVGGLVGLLNSNGGYIANSYSISTISGNDKVGGLVGYLFGDIENSYSISNVSGVGLELGGFIGNNFMGVITNSYYNNVSGNPNLAVGLEQNGQTVSARQNEISYFYGNSNEPMISWDPTVWSFNLGSLPKFFWE